jgi:hypothetical protein
LIEKPNAKIWSYLDTTEDRRYQFERLGYFVVDRETG